MRKLRELYPGFHIETLPGRWVAPPLPDKAGTGARGVNPGSLLYGECVYLHVYDPDGLRVDARWVKVGDD